MAGAMDEPGTGVANGHRLALLLAAFAVGLVVTLAPWLPGLLGAGVFYVVAAPVHRRVARVVPPRVSAATLALLLLVLVLVPGGWLVSTAVGEAAEALRAFERTGALRQLSAVRVGGVEVREQLSSGGAQLVSWLSGQAVGLFGSATRATLNLCVALLGLYYLLVSGDAFAALIRRVIPVSDEVFGMLRTRFVAVTEAMLLGTFLTAALQGTLVGAAFGIVGLPAAVFWGMVTAGAAVLPVLGSALVWLPAAGYLAAQGRYGAALFMAVAGAVVVSNLDNVVWLIVYRRVSGIHPMITLVGALAGMRVFGILGVLVGPLALSYFFELLRIHSEVSAPRIVPVLATSVDAGAPRPASGGIDGNLVTG